MSNISNNSQCEKNGKTKVGVKIYSSLDLNQSRKEMNPNPNLEINPTNIIRPKPSNVLEDHEYGCRYCNKKFTNKQALGGHQNAHKVERVIEKQEQKGREGNFGYSYTGMTSFPFPNSFNQTPKTLDPFVMNSPYYPRYIQHQMHANHNPGAMSAIPHQPFKTPSFMPYQTRMGQGTRNYQAQHNSQTNNSESIIEDDGLDLSLKL